MPVRRVSKRVTPSWEFEDKRALSELGKVAKNILDKENTKAENKECPFPLTG